MEILGKSWSTPVTAISWSTWMEGIQTVVNRWSLMLTFSKTLPYYQLTVVDGFVRLVPRKRITINNNKRDQEIEQK